MSEENESRKKILEKRAKAKKEYGKLFDAVSEILFRYDPAEINFGFNKDEYELETETILPQLRNRHSSKDVLIVVRKELKEWFNEEIADKKENEEIAEEIWHLWQNRELI